MASYCYITFPTIFFAIRAESLLKEKRCSFKMVPVPRVISSSCGTALRCSCDELDQLKKHLSASQVEMEGFYRLKEIGLRTPEVEVLTY